MANKLPQRQKALIAALIFAIFVTSVAALLIFTNESLMEDESKALMYAVVIIAIFLAVNAILLAVSYTVFRKAKIERTTRKCISCSARVDINAKACGRCGAIQPELVDENTYLDPKEDDTSVSIKKKI